MTSRPNRRALGGVLAGVALFCGAQSALAQVLPGYPVAPPSPSPYLPAYPPAPPAPSPPPGGAVPVLPGMPQQIPAEALPPMQPAQPVLGAPVQPMPLGGQPVPVPTGMGQPGGTGAPPSQPSTPAPQDPERPTMTASWGNGVFIKSADNRFSFHAGATVQYDFAWYNATPVLELGRAANLGIGKFNDGANLRRARIYFEGTLYSAVDYKFEMEFMNGIGFSPAGTTNPTIAGSVTNSPGPTDAWLNIKDVPFFGNIRIGSQKEWWSLEHLNSYRYLEFMERSYLFDLSQPTAFNNGFSPGISAFRTWLNDRVFSAVGVYKNESDLIGFGVGDGQYAVTGRLAALPIWMPDDRIYWHFGGAMSHRDPVNGQVQVRIRDNIRNAPFPLLPLVANTGLLNSSSQDLFNFETAAVYGPLTFQAEYTANIINNASVAATATAPAGPPLGDLFFQGYYAEALWLITGESRTWNTKNFFFNRVVPRRPLRLKPNDCDGYGFGAWEVGIRYSYIDLSNKGLQAGRLDSITFGVNWYMNANAKIQFNYDYTHRGDTNNPAQGKINAFGIRCAYDF